MNYTPNPRAECESPVPCPDPCVTEAVRLHRQTQPIPCAAINSTTTLVDLLVYWKMEEDNITRQDSHTGNHDATVNGTVHSYVGKILNGAVLDGGVGNYLENSESTFAFTGSYSMALWLNFDSVASNYYIIGKYHHVEFKGYKLIYEASALKLRHSVGFGIPNAEVISSATITPGLWYFVVCGYDGTNQFIQVNNGTREVVAAVAPVAASLPFRIGGAFGHDAFPGTIDEVGVWLARALSAADAHYLWNGGSGRTYPFI